MTKIKRENLSIHESLCVSPAVSLSLSLSVGLYLCMSLFVSLCLSVSLSLSLLSYFLFCMYISGEVCCRQESSGKKHGHL